jgi:DNA-binding IclR family transcriptional regulator
MIFEAFAERAQPMTLSELARLLRMPTSTCFGLLRTLEERGYLYEVGGRKCYYPTARWLAKARQIEQGDPIQDKLRPSLEKLREATAETVVLAKRLKDQVVFLSVAESTQPVRFTAAVGDLLPIHSTSSGKALLSAMPIEERNTLLNRLRLPGGVRLSPNERNQLNEDIERSSRRGWFVGRGEHVIDVMGVAAPLYLGQETLCVAIGGPRNRMEQRLHAHVRQLVSIFRTSLGKPARKAASL